MDELFERSGAFLADLLGTEAVYVTSGGAAALTLSAAACMTGMDTARIDALPDTTGMKSEILVQKKHIPSYDRCLRAAGATIVEAGGDDSCTEEELASAIGPTPRPSTTRTRPTATTPGSTDGRIRRATRTSCPSTTRPGSRGRTAYR